MTKSIWVNVGVDPQHLDDCYGEEYLYSASYCGKSFQTMEGMVIYHGVKSILERYFVNLNYETLAVYPEHVIPGILHLQLCEVLLQNLITSQPTSLLESMIEAIKFPFGSY